MLLCCIGCLGKSELKRRQNWVGGAVVDHGRDSKKHSSNHHHFYFSLSFFSSREREWIGKGGSWWYSFACLGCWCWSRTPSRVTTICFTVLPTRYKYKWASNPCVFQLHVGNGVFLHRVGVFISTLSVIDFDHYYYGISSGELWHLQTTKHSWCLHYIQYLISNSRSVSVDTQWFNAHVGHQTIWKAMASDGRWQDMHALI